MYLKLFACSPHKAPGYFAAIPLPLNFISLMNFLNRICLFDFLTDNIDILLIPDKKNLNAKTLYRIDFYLN